RQDHRQQDHIALLEPHRVAPVLEVGEGVPAAPGVAAPGRPWARASIGTSMEKLTRLRVPMDWAALVVSTGAPSPGTAAMRAMVRATWVWLKAIPSRCRPIGVLSAVAAAGAAPGAVVETAGVWALRPVSQTC